MWIEFWVFIIYFNPLPIRFAFGPTFYTLLANCSGNGGSYAGYGGIGIQDETLSNSTNICSSLTNATRFHQNLYPYGYDLEYDLPVFILNFIDNIKGIWRWILYKDEVIVI